MSMKINENTSQKYREGQILLIHFAVPLKVLATKQLFGKKQFITIYEIKILTSAILFKVSQKMHGDKHTTQKHMHYLT